MISLPCLFSLETISNSQTVSKTLTFNGIVEFFPQPIKRGSEMSKKISLFKFSSLAIAGAFTIFLLLAGVNAWANSCVDCHSRPDVDNVTGKNYQDWKGSVHDKNGVMCNACHTGNPDSNSEKIAHENVYRAGDNRSTVYFKNVPGTCGKCHKEEYTQFRKSLHFAQLETTGRGPNCVTCHGARATKIVTPSEIEGLCTDCHNKRLGIRPEIPRLAHITLLQMNQTNFLEGVLTNYLEKATVNESARKQAFVLLQQARDSLELARLKWHTFDLEAIEKSLTGAWNSSRSAWSEVNK
jgi:hypothetical protein